MSEKPEIDYDQMYELGMAFLEEHIGGLLKFVDEERDEEVFVKDATRVVVNLMDKLGDVRLKNLKVTDDVAADYFAIIGSSYALVRLAEHLRNRKEPEA